MTGGLIVWQRHSVDFVPETSYSEDETSQFLGSIPTCLKCDSLLPWLQLVLPSMFQLDSECIPMVVDWIERKAE